MPSPLHIAERRAWRDYKNFLRNWMHFHGKNEILRDNVNFPSFAELGRRWYEARKLVLMAFPRPKIRKRRKYEHAKPGADLTTAMISTR